MKSLNKTLGILSLILLAVAILFKIIHWPGGTILLTIAAAALGVFFLLYLINALGTLSAGTEKLSGISVSVVIILSVIGLAFKGNHWPGANILLMSSHILMIIAGVITLIDSINESNDTKANIKILMAYFILLMSAALFFTGLWKDIL